MKTVILNMRDQEHYWSYIESAAEALRAGELVAFPTETVYGLGAHRDNVKVVERIYEVKGRPEEKKLTLMITNRNDLKKYVDSVSKLARQLMDIFWPGPLTIIFPLKDGSSIGIRFPDNAVTIDLIRTAKVPVLTTSANISGYPPATDAQQVLMDLGGKIHTILDGGSTRLRSPSTVIKVQDETLEIVRHGIISEACIRSCLENSLIKGNI
ncbi:MAG: L-threonylcarbamoyladenylate synthase [Candidatus Loosdrechtia sp.]|uniref:L-threonylcarbamoyladenylate synthase n=1 Tax=Candidatus Loosdrechtia sp. TaxID=3101272 RepID=UPI003A6F6EF1|nr:MAG: L-threonylcarbamoyladenylate synthase [Candidatus Jettenia sp. AMX2]